MCTTDQTIAQTSSLTTKSGSSSLSRLTAVVGWVLRLVRRRPRRNPLSDLDDYMLNDIGQRKTYDPYDAEALHRLAAIALVYSPR